MKTATLKIDLDSSSSHDDDWFPRVRTFTRKEGWRWIANIYETRREIDGGRGKRTRREGTVSLGQGKTVPALEHRPLWKRLDTTETSPLGQENRETLVTRGDCHAGQTGTGALCCRPSESERETKKLKQLYKLLFQNLVEKRMRAKPRGPQKIFFF